MMNLARELKISFYYLFIPRQYNRLVELYDRFEEVKTDILTRESLKNDPEFAKMLASLPVLLSFFMGIPTYILPVNQQICQQNSAETLCLNTCEKAFISTTGSPAVVKPVKTIEELDRVTGYDDQGNAMNLRSKALPILYYPSLWPPEKLSPSPVNPTLSSL